MTKDNLRKLFNEMVERNFTTIEIADTFYAIERHLFSKRESHMEGETKEYTDFWGKAHKDYAQRLVEELETKDLNFTLEQIEEGEE